MKSIHIRNVRPETLEALKRLARSHRRSLQGELHEILERAAQEASPTGEIRPPSLVTVSTPGKQAWRREEIYGEDAR